ncbi:MAG: cytochrome c oxidase subunit II [Solirubrobacteraceae bacterium]
MSDEPAHRLVSDEANHGRNFAVLWAISSVVLVALMIFVIGPHVPPGSMTNDTRAQHDVIVVLSTISMPVLALIWTFLVYAIVNFRARKGVVYEDGPALHANPGLQITWVAVTALMVLGLAAYGTIDLLTAAGKSGVGSGEGPNPLAKPANAGKALQVQVIGQQWFWSFRYPAYGGVETSTLEIPVNTDVEFHVTSLDVVHSFWAIELGVKADAVPGADNVAFVTAFRKGSFQIRCNELCGLWHGHMTSTGHVVAPSAFKQWIAAQETRYAPVTKQLPPYSTTYYPIPTRNG